MAQSHPAPLAYTSPTADEAALPAWLRRVAGWGAVAYGGFGALAKVDFIAITRKWFPAGPDFGQFTPLQDAFEWAQVAAYVLMLLAGVLILRRSAAGVAALRLGAALTIATVCGEQTYSAMTESSSLQWRGLNVLSALAGVAMPALLSVLTIGPLGRAVRHA
jgi:hypothetical protein